MNQAIGIGPGSSWGAETRKELVCMATRLSNKKRPELTDEIIIMNEEGLRPASGGLDSLELFSLSSWLQWKVRASNGSSKLLVPESGLICRTWQGFLGLLAESTLKLGKFLKKAWALGVEDPKKIIHSFKVGTALTLVSMFYYVNPLYDGIGDQDAIWAVMTVVVIFEYTAGATISKSTNRVTGSILAGMLAVFIQWTASHFGEPFELLILGASVCLAASAATFARFIPIIKLRFDYGAMIFILTYSLIAVSGFRIEKLFQMGYLRVSNVAIGVITCFFISMFICPVWAGEELHLLITRNMENLANSLDGCLVDYFKEKNNNGKVENEDKAQKSFLGYKCVLNSKAAEESIANLALWEPPHGCFRFRHPWKQYLKIGASMRNCAFCIEVLNSCMKSEFQAPDSVKKHLSDACIQLSFHCSIVLKELAISIKTMRRSFKIVLSNEEMKDALRELQNVLNSLSTLLSTPPPLSSPIAENSEEMKDPISTPTIVSLGEVVPLLTVASILIELVARIEGVIKAVNELANLAGFISEIEKPIKPTIRPSSEDKNQQTMKVLQQV